MRNVAYCVALSLWLLAGQLVAAEEKQAVAVAADEKPATAGKAVTVEILIVDLADDVKSAAAPTEISAERIRELEKQGKITSTARIRLSAIEHIPAMVQFGERVPMATGRTATGRGAFDGGFATSYSFQNVGTLAQVTSRVEQDGAVVLELQVERSRVLPAEPDAAAEKTGAGSFTPQRTSTITAKSTVRVPVGKTIIAGGQQSSAKESGQTWVLVTATVDGAKK